VDDQAFAGVVLTLEIKIQLRRLADELLCKRGGLKIKCQSLVRQACDRAKAGRLSIYLQDRRQ